MKRSSPIKSKIAVLILACSTFTIATETQILTKRITINTAASNKILRANEKVAYTVQCGSGQYDLYILDFRPILFIHQYDKLNLSNSEDLVINANPSKLVAAKRIDKHQNCKAIVAQFEDIKNQVELTVHDIENFELNFR